MAGKRIRKDPSELPMFQWIPIHNVTRSICILLMSLNWKNAETQNRVTHALIVDELGKLIYLPHHFKSDLTLAS